MQTATVAVINHSFPHGRGFKTKEKITDPVLRTVLEALHSDSRTIVELAKLAGIASSTIYKWEDGSTKRPQYYTISQVMKVLGYRNKWYR